MNSPARGDAASSASSMGTSGLGRLASGLPYSSGCSCASWRVSSHTAQPVPSLMLCTMQQRPQLCTARAAVAPPGSFTIFPPFRCCTCATRLCCRGLVALARGTVLAVLPVEEDGQQQCVPDEPQHQRAHIHCAQHAYTALAWFVQLRASACDDGQPVPATAPEQAAAATPPLGGAPPPPLINTSQKLLRSNGRLRHGDAAALAEAELLLSGTADGCLQLHDACGVLLFRQQLSAGPVLDILVRPHCSGERLSERVSE